MAGHPAECQPVEEDFTFSLCTILFTLCIMGMIVHLGSCLSTEFLKSYFMHYLQKCINIRSTSSNSYSSSSSNIISVIS